MAVRDLSEQLVPGVSASTSRDATRARRDHILSLVASGETAVESLSETLGVSPSTIRRDLSELRRGGKITRTYGGALPGGHIHESSLAERDGQAWAEKQSIVDRAISFIADGDTLFLDGGTTVGLLVRKLSGFSDLTIITNAVSEVPALLESSFSVIFLGGELRRPSQSTVGPLAEESLRRLSADHAFLGADGIVAGRGICEADLNQTVVKEAMARNASRAYVLADGSKIGVSPFGAWAILPENYTLITDSQTNDDQLAPFRALPGVDVIVAPPRAS